MKRKITVVAAVLAVVILVSFMLTGITAAAATVKKVIMSNAYYTAPYCAVYNPAAIAKAKELGIELQVLDGEGNQQKQLEQAKIAVVEANGFIYFPADVGGSIPVIEALKGFPYIVVNNYSLDALKKNGVPYYVGPNVIQHGYNMSELLFKLFPNKKANLVAIEGPAGHSQTILFNQAFDEKLKGTGFVWLNKQNADFDPDKAFAKVTDMLTKYGDKIDCIIVHDGGMAAGAIASLKAAGKKAGDIPIICAGSNKSIYAGLMSGFIYGTSSQDPGVEGELGVETMNKILNGEKVEPLIYLPMSIVTKENADKFSWF